MQHKFKPFDKVLVRGGDNGIWRADMFSHVHCDLVWLTSDNCYSPSCACVIPYEGNERLLGTTDDPILSEPKFKFGDKVEYKDGGFFESQKTWKHAIYIGFNHNKNTHILLTSQCVNIGEDLNQAKLLEGNGEIRHADW